MKNQPFLTSFPLSIFATAKRRFQAALRAQHHRVIRKSISGYALLFESVLPPDFLEGIDPTKRQRSFGHIPVFWAWLAQVLEANASCSKALGFIQAWYQASGLAAPTGGTSGYCMARVSLREDFLEQAAQRITNTLGQRIGPMDMWHGITTGESPQQGRDKDSCPLDYRLAVAN